MITRSRHRRSQSCPAPRRPPGYGPKATIPEYGFLVDPEKLLRKGMALVCSITKCIPGSTVSSTSDKTRTAATAHGSAVHSAPKAAVPPSPNSFSTSSAANITMASTTTTHGPRAPQQITALRIIESPHPSSSSTISSMTHLQPTIAHTHSSAVEHPVGLRPQASSSSTNSKTPQNRSLPSSLFTESTATTKCSSTEIPRYRPPQRRCSIPTASTNDPPLPHARSTPVIDRHVVNELAKVRYLDTPNSHDKYAKIYNAFIHKDLIRVLSNTVSTFVVTLLYILGDDGTDKVPTICIFTNDKDVKKINLDERFLHIKGFVWVVGTGHFQYSRSVTSAENPYQMTLASGAAIALSDSKNYTTLGLFLKGIHDDQLYGVTSGHIVMRDAAESQTIFQPSTHDFLEYRDRMGQRYETVCQDFDVKWGGRQYSDAREKALDKFEETRKLFDFTMSDTLDLSIGPLVIRHWMPIRHRDDDQEVDIALIKLTSDRKPTSTSTFDGVPPSRGILSHVPWHSFTDEGAADFDLMVRKDGATSKLTYGVISGVRIGVKDKDRPFTLPTNEFYILREDVPERSEFSAPGDSGSAIVDNLGRLVGVISSSFIFDDVEMVVDRWGKLDIMTMRKYRLRGGDFDPKKIFVTSRLVDREVSVMCDWGACRELIRRQDYRVYPDF